MSTPMSPPRLHHLYRFVTVAASGEEVDQEWEGWWSGRNWHALYDLGIWDPQFVVRWEPLLTEERCCEGAERDRKEFGKYSVHTCSDAGEQCHTRLVTKWSPA